MDSKDEKDEKMNLTLAIKEYDKIFKQKTSKAKGYSALEMRSGGDEKETTEAVDPTDSALEMEPSKLEPAVQSLMEFIHDKKAMEKLVIKAGYDVSKLPIGKLSEETILEGYKYLS